MREVNTRQGRRWVECFAPDAQFWRAWEERKGELYGRCGVGLKRNTRTGAWTVFVWGVTRAEVWDRLKRLRQVVKDVCCRLDKVPRAARALCWCDRPCPPPGTCPPCQYGAGRPDPPAPCLVGKFSPPPVDKDISAG